MRTRQSQRVTPLRSRDSFQRGMVSSKRKVQRRTRTIRMTVRPLPPSEYHLNAPSVVLGNAQARVEKRRAKTSGQVLVGDDGAKASEGAN